MPQPRDGLRLRITLPVLLHPVVERVLYALIFIADDSLKTLPVGLSEFVVSDFAFWGQLMAAAALASLPVIVVYIYLHKHMMQGLTAGAVKG